MLSTRALLPCRVGGESGGEQMARAQRAPVVWVQGDPAPPPESSGLSWEQGWSYSRLAC